MTKKSSNPETDNKHPDSRYRVLPQIDEDIAKFVLEDDAGPVKQSSKTFGNLNTALKRIDDELQGLSEANPHLASLVCGIVAGTYSVFGENFTSERDKALLRVVSYVDAFVILRALDMQMRKANQTE